MIGVCTSLDGAPTVAERLAAFLDCQAARIDTAAFDGGLWHGLPGDMVSAVLAVYVAVVGYRLVLGRPIIPADLALIAARAGVMLALATSWSAYSTLIVHPAADGPRALAAMVIGADVPPISELARKVGDELESINSRPLPLASAAQGGSAQTATGQTPPTQSGGVQPGGTQNPPQTPAGSLSADGREPALTFANTIFTISAIGFVLAARLGVSLLLALGPLLACGLLFDWSLWLFIGWLRALAAAILSMTGVLILSGLETGFFAGELLRTDQAREIVRSEPLFLGWMFCLLSIGIIAASFKATSGGVALLKTEIGKRVSYPTRLAGSARAETASATSTVHSEVSRVVRILDAVRGLEARAGAGAASSAGGRIEAARFDPQRAFASARNVPGPQSGLRRPDAWRGSGAATRRNDQA